MALKILSVKEYSVKLKATIHASGRLGFTEATAKELNLNSASAIAFAQDDEDENLLYLINTTIENEDAFKVMKAGVYFSVGTKPLFDRLGFDYKNNNISFDMVREKNEEIDIYKLLKKITPRK
ncbi:MAG: hypothetical protein SNG27_06395 [Rikenellaceae bacterium]